MKAKITSEQVDAILNLILRERISVVQVAKAMGIHRDTVRHILYAHGYHKVGGKWVKATKES